MKRLPKKGEIVLYNNQEVKILKIKLEVDKKSSIEKNIYEVTLSNLSDSTNKISTLLLTLEQLSVILPEDALNFKNPPKEQIKADVVEDFTSYVKPKIFSVDEIVFKKGTENDFEKALKVKEIVNEEVQYDSEKENKYVCNYIFDNNDSNNIEYKEKELISYNSIKNIRFELEFNVGQLVKIESTKLELHDHIGIIKKMDFENKLFLVEIYYKEVINNLIEVNKKFNLLDIKKSISQINKFWVNKDELILLSPKVPTHIQFIKNEIIRLKDNPNVLLKYLKDNPHNKNLIICSSINEEKITEYSIKKEDVEKINIDFTSIHQNKLLD
jgi:hypothetical protein